MFNVTGGELVIILLVALIVLGPEKLPDAIRKVGRVYGELRRMSAGFQSELKDALDEPMREMRDTMNTVKGGFTFGDDGEPPTTATPSEGPRLPPHDGAAQAEPAQAEPAEAEPAQAEPAQAEPAQAEPAQAEPAEAEPAEPAQAESPETEPAAAASSGNGTNGSNGNGTVAVPPVASTAPPAEEPAAPAEND